MVVQPERRVPRLGVPLRIYIGSVVVLGSGTLALSLFQQPLELTSLELTLAAVFAVLIALAGAYPIPLSPKVKVDVITAPLFAAVLLLQPGIAVIAVILGVAAAEVALKRAWPNVLFNTAAAALYTGAASMALMAIAGAAPFFAWPLGVAGAALAASMVYLVNRATVAGAAALETGKSPLRLWQQGWKGDLAQELTLFSLAYAGALAVHTAPWTLVLLVVPVVLVHKAFSTVVALSCELEVQMAQLKAAEAQLVQAAKMVSLGTMASGIGHQINNPVFVIRGRAELLLEGADKHIKSERARQHLEVIRDMANRVARIVRCLLMSSRPSEDGAACTDINEALESMVTVLDSRLSASRVHVTREYQEGLPLVRGDPVEIQEMFGNVILNGCDAMPHGGELRLITRTADSSVVVEISDTGVGIPEANLARVFDPFFTTKEEQGGMGLGLYVVKNIAQKYGGTVQVESRQGQGTTFYISLPAADGDHPQRWAGQPGKTAARTRILVAGSGSPRP